MLGDRPPILPLDGRQQSPDTAPHACGTPSERTPGPSGRTDTPDLNSTRPIPRESPRHHTQPAAEPMKSIPYIHRRTIDIETRKGSPRPGQSISSFFQTRNERTDRRSPGSVHERKESYRYNSGRTIRNQFRVPGLNPGTRLR